MQSSPDPDTALNENQEAVPRKPGGDGRPGREATAAAGMPKPKPTPPREIAPKPKAYAFERSLGIPPADACRRAGGKVENGQATKWERSRRVQAWIAYYRSLGQDDEMIAAKRSRIEERLALAAFGNIFDFANIEPLTKNPMIDWEKVVASPEGVIIAGFKFDKDTGRLVDFERDNAMQAIVVQKETVGLNTGARGIGTSAVPKENRTPTLADVGIDKKLSSRALSQLRDMNGFKAPSKTAFTDPSGENPGSLYLISEKPMSEEEWEAQRAVQGGACHERKL
jgi:hypothetical protein